MMFQASHPATDKDGDPHGKLRFGRQRLPLRSRVLIATLAVLAACAPSLYANYARHSQAEAHLYRGQEFLQRGSPQDAEREWQAAAQLTPDNPNPYRALGELYRAQGRIPEASAAYNRLADLRPHEPHLLCELAAVEKRSIPEWDASANSRIALHDAIRAATLEPDCVRALTTAGDICMERGDQKQGLGYLRHAVRLKPEDVPLILHCINSLFTANDIAGALQMARDLTQRYPGYAQGYALMAVACDLYPPDSPEAGSTEGLLLTALRLDPTNALAHVRLGFLYLKERAAKRAIPHLEAAHLLGYHKGDLMFQLTQAYRETGQTARAKRSLEDFYRISHLENEQSTLEQKAATEPDNADIRRQLDDVNAALTLAQRAYDREYSASRPHPAARPHATGNMQ
jgi:predicted Zn-dependent protease